MLYGGEEMNTRQLQYVITLANERSFSEASNKLMISQPSLSQYIQKLEKELGTELFERTLPLKLTYAGEIYIKAAKKILDIEKSMNEQINDFIDGMSGKIIVGTGFFNSIILLPNIISVFQKQYPEVEIILNEDIEPNLKIKADAGEIDLIISTKSIDDVSYEKVHLLKEEFLLAVPLSMSVGSSGNRATSIRTIEFEKVKDLPFIMLENNTLIRMIIEKLSSEHGGTLKKVVECTSSTAAYGMVKAGVGISLVPLSTYKMDYSPNVCYYKIAENDTKREIILYYKKNKYVPKIMQAFIDEIKRYVEENYLDNLLT